MKKNVMTTISADLHNQAKEKRLNVSYELEKALRSKLNGNIDDSEEDMKCKFCDMAGVRMIRDNMKDPNALIWLCPDEVWCCNACLNEKVKLLELTIASRG